MEKIQVKNSQGRSLYELEKFDKNKEDEINNFKKKCMDFGNISAGDRYKYLIDLFKLSNLEGTDMLNRYKDSLAFLQKSQTSFVIDVLEQIVTNESPFFDIDKFSTILTLYNRGYIGLCYKHFSNFAFNDSYKIDLRLDCCRYLFISDDTSWKSHSQECLLQIISDHKYPTAFRYKIVCGYNTKTGLSVITKTDKIRVYQDEPFLFCLQNAFFWDKKNLHEYRILSAQYMITAFENDSFGSDDKEKDKEVICNEVLDMANGNINLDDLEIKFESESKKKVTFENEISLESNLNNISKENLTENEIPLENNISKENVIENEIPLENNSKSETTSLKELDKDLDDDELVNKNEDHYKKKEDYIYKIRADAADVLLRLGNADQMLKARNIIVELGYSASLHKTIYNNAENVHDEQITKSVVDYIEKMVTTKSLKVISFDETYNDFKEALTKENLIKDRKERLKILSVLNRVSIDTSTFTSYKVTISEIFSYVWHSIKTENNPDKKKFFMKRFIEDIINSSGKCSSGLVFNFVNALSDENNVIVKISFEDQICANIDGRISALIKGCTDKTLQEELMLGMMDTAAPGERETYTQFIISNLPALKTQLLKEFVIDEPKHLERKVFEEYFDKSLVKLYKIGKTNHNF